MHGEDSWRTTTAGRVARLAAYSLGGGAVVTVLGATAASATGDTDAKGNSSSTGMTQTLQVTDPAAPTVVDLEAGVGNVGGAGANSGVNEAIDDTGEDFRTGRASAGGNESATTVDQGAIVSGGTSGPIVVRERAGVLNAGLGVANTGINQDGNIDTGWATASGNRSTTTLSQLTNVTGAGALVIVDQSAGVGNLGLGVASSGINRGGGPIDTGNAGASGNEANTDAAQEASGDALEAAAAVQRTRIGNVGGAFANTGVNEHVEDDSTSDPEEED
jgi:hypothetical protein